MIQASGLHLLCTLFLLLLHQLCLRSSDIRSQRLGTPPLDICIYLFILKMFCEKTKDLLGLGLSGRQAFCNLCMKELTFVCAQSVL